MNKIEFITTVKLAINEPIKTNVQLYGGMMNESCLINDKYIAYNPTDQANEMVNRYFEKFNSQIAYNLGLTSKTVYFDVVRGVKVNEFIQGSSLDKINEFDYKKVAELLHKYHASETKALNNYEPFKRFINNYEKEAKGWTRDYDPRYETIRNVIMDNKEFLESQPLVMSHNDAQRSNIIKDNNGNYFLIDFEFSGNNDEIYDIATFGNGDVEEGYKLLQVYFDNKPTKEQEARYFLWRMFISLQWYNVALTKHHRGEGETHQINFLDVAKHFINNADNAYQRYMELKD